MHHLWHTFILCIDFKAKLHPICILQYSYPKDPDMKGLPHKNSKKGSASFNRSKKSLLTRIKDQVIDGTTGPTKVYNKVVMECGGILNASSCGSLPRNRKQVANAKSNLKIEPTVKDPLFSVMEECKQQQSRADPFLRMVQAAPDAMCLLANSRQLNDMARFCTDPNQCCVLGIDPTFNLGEFSVTVITYKHLQLIDRHTKKSPVLVGPMLIHQKKTMESFHFLASGIVGLSLQLNSLVAYGTDGEKAIGDAFHIQFPQAQHLLCFIHVRNRISAKLRDLGISGDYVNAFITDVFSQQQGTHKFCGLVDCDSPQQFDKELSQLQEVWDNREMCIRSSTDAKFYSWFVTYQASNFKEKMLKPLRSAVGLGVIPVEYTNNPNESANARIKAKVDYKKSGLHVFCQEMKELVDSQTHDIESAFTMDIGPFAVSNAYSRYKQNPRSWVKETKSYRQRCINQIHKIQLFPVKAPTTSMLTTSSSENSSGAAQLISNSDKESVSQCNDNQVLSDDQKENFVPLSVSWKEAGLSEEVFGSMWKKAAHLAVDEGSITPAPGLPNSKMVASFSCPEKPHVVAVLDSGKITCDCLNYKSKSLCSHTLAVAEKSGELVRLLQWYNRTNQSANLWSLARSLDAPKRPGAKPGTNTRKRSRVSNPPLKTCSSIRATQSNDTLRSSSQTLSPEPTHIQFNEQFQPSPRAPWFVSSGSTESHYTGPSHLSYSMGSSESHYAGPQCSYSFGSGPQCSYSFGSGPQCSYSFGSGPQCSYSFGSGPQCSYSFGSGPQCSYSFGSGPQCSYSFGSGPQCSYSFGSGPQCSYSFGSGPQCSYSFGSPQYLPFSHIIFNHISHARQFSRSTSPLGNLLLCLAL